MIKGLLIRADASPLIGCGHIMRCLRLAEAYRARGGQAALLSHCPIPELRQRIQQSGILFASLGQPHPHPSDLARTLELARTGRFEWLVLDGYHFEPEYQRTLGGIGIRMMILDDMAHQSAYHADLIVNQNINADDFRYRGNSGMKILRGPQYILLQKEFLLWAGWTRDIPEIGHKVLVTLGGSDPQNQTLKVIQALGRLKGLDLQAVVISGAGNPYGRELETAAAGLKWVRLLHHADDMAGLMAWADVAVSAGGSTCWEMAFMGLPNAVLVLADNQAGIAAGLNKAGIAWSLGWWEDLHEDEICQAMYSLMEDRERRREMSHRGRCLVDGRGAERVVAWLREEIREARADR